LNQRFNLGLSSIDKEIINAGIINIKLIKNKSFGINGSVSAGYNIGETSKYNSGVSLNYRNKNINIFSTYSFSYAPNHQHLTAYRTVADSIFDQSARIIDITKSHNFKVGVDYLINKKNIIGVIVNGVMSDPSSIANGRTNISSTTNGLDRALISSNDNYMRRHNVNTNFNYSYTDPKGTSTTINADHGIYHLNSNQLQQNHYYDPTEQILKSSAIYHIFSPSKIDLNSIKADYEQNFLKGKLGIGGKSVVVKTDNDFQQYDIIAGLQELDKDRSNHFIYKENINAGYVNFNRKYKQFFIQAGIRVENTISRGESNGLTYNGSGYTSGSSLFSRSYTDLFPSAAITFNKNPKQVWNFTYSRRIDRPAYQDLNPFEFKLDEYTFVKGNVNLRPQYTNSFGISQTYNYKLNMSLNYSHVKDLFTQIFDTVEKSKAFLSKKNLATEDIVNFTASLPYQHKSYNLFASVSSNYSMYRADFGAGRKVDVNAFGFTAFLQNSIKFHKSWTAELSGFYNAPTIYMGTFKGRSIYNVDAGLSKQVMKTRATIKASFSDVFHTLHFNATSTFAGQIAKVGFQQESSQLKLSFNYRFGRNTIKNARQRTTGAEEESKRVQQKSGIGF